MKVNFLNLAHSKSARIAVVKVEGISYEAAPSLLFLYYIICHLLMLDLVNLIH